MLEPLFLLSPRPPKQIEGELSARGARASLLSSASRIVSALCPVALCFGHKVVLFVEVDADGVFLVPDALPGQVLGQQVDLEEVPGRTHIRGRWRRSLLLEPATHLAVAEVIDLLTDVGDLRFRFIVRCTTSNVVVGLGQTDDGSFQPDKHRVCQRGVVHLRVIA